MRRSSGFPILSFFFCTILGFTRQTCAQQTFPPGNNTAAAFLAEVALKYPGAVLLQSVTLNANAKWTLGNQKESGTAVLQAQSDGSSSMQLTLDTASRTESRTALGNSRACQWTDSQGNHQLNPVDCNASVAWFAPVLSIQPLSTVLQLLNIVDDGQATRDSGVFRQISFRTPLSGISPFITSFMTTGTHVSVLYNQQTLLPDSVEFTQHSDKDLNTTIPVRIVYSNYQPVAGVPVPYQIDRYVGNLLQLSLTITSVSLK